MGLRRSVAAAIVAICIMCPAIETFDRWDHTAQDGNDTEANTVIAALCVGLAFAIGSVAIVQLVRALLAPPPRRPTVARRIRIADRPFATPIPTISPPLPLRI